MRCFRVVASETGRREMQDEIMTPDEWGEREARKAPAWTLEDLKRCAGILGLRLRPIEPQDSDVAA